jgi:hypothetical protein
MIHPDQKLLSSAKPDVFFAMTVESWWPNAGLHMTAPQIALHVMPFRSVSSTGDDVYGPRFADGSTVWQIGLTEDQRIRSREKCR